ncbi:MAG: pyridoxamine 5'-phosphate oxidase family protein [Candidatus Omnitrophota bacterium]
MSLLKYFENTQGMGILATADSKGVIDTAVYGRPHFIDEQNCVFLMADKLSHKNIQENSKASYAFIEKDGHYQGKRLYLTKTKEVDDSALVDELRRKKHGCQYDSDKKTFVVYFKVDSVRPLVGDSAENTKVKTDTCPTCLQTAGDSGHMCVPSTKKDEKCNWCGAMIPTERHLCNEKVKKLAYICNSCGRTAVKAEYLCKPKKIEN